MLNRRELLRTSAELAGIYTAYRALKARRVEASPLTTFTLSSPEGLELIEGQAGRIGLRIEGIGERVDPAIVHPAIVGENNETGKGTELLLATSGAFEIDRHAILRGQEANFILPQGGFVAMTARNAYVQITDDIKISLSAGENVSWIGGIKGYESTGVELPPPGSSRFGLRPATPHGVRVRTMNISGFGEGEVEAYRFSGRDSSDFLSEGFFTSQAEKASQTNPVAVFLFDLNLRSITVAARYPDGRWAELKTNWREPVPQPARRSPTEFVLGESDIPQRPANIVR